MKTVFNFFQDFLNDRPRAVMATAGGIRDFLLGLGFLLGLDQIRQTQIFMNYDALVPGITGDLAGAMFLIVGLMVTFGAAFEKKRMVTVGLRCQAFSWMFSTLMYLIAGHFMLAAIFGIFFCFPAGYLAFRYKFSHDMLTDLSRSDRLEQKGERG